MKKYLRLAALALVALLLNACANTDDETIKGDQPAIPNMHNTGTDYTTPRTNPATPSS